MKALVYLSVLVAAASDLPDIHAQGRNEAIVSRPFFKRKADSIKLISSQEGFSIYRLPTDNMPCFVLGNLKKTMGNPLVNFYSIRGYTMPNGAEIENIPFSKKDTTKKSNGYLFISSGCGFAGTTSPEFGYYRAIIRNKIYNTLRADLLSPDLLKKVLSVIAVDSLAAAGVLTLTENEKSIIEELKLSRQGYSVCSGCTMQQFGYVSDIFTSNEKGASVLNFLKAKLGFRVPQALDIPQYPAIFSFKRPL